jgi:hypothetical protein
MAAAASLMIVMFSISELLIVDIMSRPASELIVLIEPERIGIPSITYNGELLALKDPIPRIFKEEEVVVTGYGGEKNAANIFITV